MSEIFELQAGFSRATISTDGAWLERLQLDGVAVLFPKTTLATADGSQKIRGGCHVCLPNFGPDANGVLPQHGFARDSKWQVVDNAADRCNLRLTIETGDYAGMHANLIYELEDNAMSMRLSVTNNGEKPFQVAPAFHPYFSCGSTAVVVDNAEYSRYNIEKPLPLDVPTDFVLGTNDQSYKLSSYSLKNWILWSDNLGEYVCVEPTQSGFSFGEPGMVKADTISPQHSRQHSFTIQRRI